ncbi:MAG: biotin--[acetyl-CoA-carboxylase] ligase [Prevotellaceae bacterium]|nr:biotin--[acetyl-CoA-carboxylase] ligase [Prevotellaceae bacterium]
MRNKTFFLKEVDSTNNEAARHLDAAPHGAVWVTSFQQAGRGQQENRWESENGKNLLFSVLLRPASFRAESQFLISQIVALGICDYLRALDLPALIKWTNDVYVSHRKIAGILIEHHIYGEYINSTIAGIGLNVNQMQFHHAPLATSMALEAGREYTLNTVLDELLTYIFKRYDGHYATLHTDYLNALYLYRQWSWYEAETRRFRAQITDVKPTGELVLQHENGTTEAFLQKSIVFLPHDFTSEN